VQKIIRANEKASVLVNDLLAYSKPAQLVLSPIPIAEMVKEMVNALKDHSQFSQIQFCLENSSPHTVLCDPVKLEQVFYNLFKNAADAMGGKGKLILRFDEVLLDMKPAVVVQVQDNGPGIDASIINRIFDPFFTTKGHCGVGLGLSVSYRTVEQHGGLLSVESLPGQGARFSIKLPVYLGQGAQSTNLSG
jgi:two-component system NtrC family sensor kinase